VKIKLYKNLKIGGGFFSYSRTPWLASGELRRHVGHRFVDARTGQLRGVDDGLVTRFGQRVFFYNPVISSNQKKEENFEIMQ
jgi:hypothetical protein